MGNVLVVEGKDDRHSVVGLMRAHVPWPQDPLQWPVEIRERNGKEAIFEDGYLSGVLKEPGTRALGLLLDADDDAQDCYDRVRDRWLPSLPDMPADLPDDGLILESEDAPRCGVWVMPDNRSRGDLETFLRYLVPARFEPVWGHAERSTVRARELGADYRDAHVAKASMHAWLAWQDPPGRPLGVALTAKVLDSHSPGALPFVNWFRALYGLGPAPA